MTLPVAGWYPDPQDPNRTRWWDGGRWGALAPQPPAPVSVPSTDQAPRPPAPSEYRSVAVERPLRGRSARIEKDRATRAANPYGYAGLVLALIAFIVNVLAIPGILGIVFGAIGLARAAQITGQRTTGFGVSLAAVIVGLVASAAFALRAAQLFA
ncbi:DUF2510 domain-containing protein [Curtobacterium sp. VKM Ac-2852]|jgi:Protein of unknown function (DUF2510)|uniref:DUF2510 domain-containing protein n=1 Tax=Curtobacterium sp. VKM Ac-2852 TaxID=2739024 RepID=UPI00156655B0|nr:DUF2510 domain-containing protein [Curtobacterium sp. VKM Ac-2852]NQX24791.1 DUF2510 domain-containing protein [Curtobacterium sp. VKM Ac-2852]